MSDEDIIEDLYKARQALRRDDELRAPGRVPYLEERRDRYVAKLLGGLLALLGTGFIAYAPVWIEERGHSRVMLLEGPAIIQGGEVVSRGVYTCGATNLFSSEEPSRGVLNLIIGGCADYYQIPRGLLLAVVDVESRFNIHAVGAHGEIGLMQLKEATAASLGVNPHSWPENIEGGARYLAGCKVKGGKLGTWRAALECYNSGSDRRAYADKILREWERGSKERGME